MSNIPTLTTDALIEELRHKDGSPEWCADDVMALVRHAKQLEHLLAAEKALYEANEREKIAKLTTANERIKELEHKLAEEMRGRVTAMKAYADTINAELRKQNAELSAEVVKIRETLWRYNKVVSVVLLEGGVNTNAWWKSIIEAQALGAPVLFSLTPPQALDEYVKETVALLEWLNTVGGLGGEKHGAIRKEISRLTRREG